MNIRLILAWLHLIALSFGLAGVWARARGMRESLRHPDDASLIRRAFVGDAWWGVAAILWLITGVWRLVKGTEKSPSYYMTNQAFLLKMGLFLTIVALEIWPMMTLIRWRTKKAVPNQRDVGRIEIISYVQCALVVVMVFAAVSMARGFGSGASAAPLNTPGATPTSDATPRPANGAPNTAVPANTAPVDVIDPVLPSGTEIVTDADIALLTRSIAMPLDGVDPAKLHSSFDERRGGGTRPHEALDLMAARGTPVKSATGGRVLRLFNSVPGGLMVYAADSSERFILMYGHLDGYAAGLHDGSPLVRGQVIGYVGSTGNAQENAPHLHFAIARSADVKQWSKGKPIDPLPLLQHSSR
ncbi:MAG: DUF2214 family protein [Gemmatimonadota bacterium]